MPTVIEHPRMSAEEAEAFRALPLETQRRMVRQWIAADHLESERLRRQNEMWERGDSDHDLNPLVSLPGWGDAA